MSNQMSIDLEGRIKGLAFKGDEQGDVVATITIECQPNELEAGTLSRFAGKGIEFSILSRQIGLPLRKEAEPARVLTEVGPLGTE